MVVQKVHTAAMEANIVDFISSWQARATALISADMQCLALCHLGLQEDLSVPYNANDGCILGIRIDTHTI